MGTRNAYYGSFPICGNAMSSTANSKFSSLQRAGALAVSAGGVVGAINDLLDPLIALSSFTLAALVIAMVITVAAAASTRVRNTLAALPAPKPVSDLISQYWALPLFSALVVLAAVILGATFITEKSGDAGFIAEAIPGVAALKRDVGIIRQTAQNIEKNTGKIAAQAEQLNEKANNLKRETSLDPQKELANMGVAWSNDHFADALIRGDEKVVSLFLAAGWNPLSGDEGAGNAIGRFVWHGSDLADKAARILDLLVQHGVDVETSPVRFYDFPSKNFATNAAVACNLPLLVALKSKGARMDVARNFVRSTTNLVGLREVRAGAPDSIRTYKFAIQESLECPRDWLEQISKILNVV